MTADQHTFRRPHESRWCPIHGHGCIGHRAERNRQERHRAIEQRCAEQKETG